MRTGLCLILCLVGMAGRSDPAGNFALGSGHRGLVLGKVAPFDSKQAPFTVAIMCYPNPGFFLSADSEGGPEPQTLIQETLPPDQLRRLPDKWWSGWLTLGLFSFGHDAAFDGRDLYRIEQGHLRIYPYAALPEARKSYGLADNHLFLGAFDGRVFYWDKDAPQAVYFKADHHTYRYRMPPRVLTPLGMAKGAPKGDLALYAVVKRPGWFTISSTTHDWIVLNLKDAERLP